MKEVITGALRDALRERAKYFVGLPVMWRGMPYRVITRYWRKRSDNFVYDLREIVDAGPTRYQNKVRETEIEPFKRRDR
jgi:hypothetical protein